MSREEGSMYGPQDRIHGVSAIQAPGVIDVGESVGSME